ncbi:MAG: hypothetical protein JWO03_788 [Bacteroidetes bacterium]|nr:hypothetical protein [Bacteroidota bacterium]
MIKPLLSYCLIFVFSLQLFSQKKADSKYKALEYNKFKSFYTTAVTFQDTSAMINGLIGILSIYPQDTESLKKLSQLYFVVENYNSALFACRRYIELAPNDIDILKIQATCMQINMQYDDALLLYTELFYRTRQPYYKYLAANMEYELFRQAECLKTIADCLNLPTADKDQVEIKVEENHSQWVSIKAACLNLRGLALLDMKEMEQARSAFEESLKISPDFIMAQRNLQLMQAPKHNGQ